MLTCILCPLRGHPAGLFVYFGEGGMRSMRGRGVDLYTLSPAWSLCWSVYLLWWRWRWGEGVVEGLTCTFCPMCSHSAGLFIYFGGGGGGEKEG